MTIDLAPPLPPALYVVATPIGNLGDITLRALEVLRGVDRIACEDTRHSRPLLQHHGIGTPLFAVHQHNELASATRIVEALQQGERIALISDAGTPGISDPGAVVVAAVQAAGLAVVPIPGPSALACARSASGLPPGPVTVVGFLPAKAAARRKALAGLAAMPGALVFYEAPHRVVEAATDMAALLGGGRACLVARELTKRFETLHRLPLGEAAAWLQANPDRQRGEFVLVVDPAAAQAADTGAADALLRVLLEELPPNQAARLAAKASGIERQRLYRRALELKPER
ncbi:MAG: 16S rRNA (cytidine(1402)-2'-O)-methyltransferase [Rhodocyclaceae bacterium]|nr:16S rRNA (cytidine(1402)-2'-O)-methyltransferase [Rhodocyclaceae bacterium]